MTLLQFLVIISSIVFFLIAIDAYQRKKLNLLHFLFFFGGSGILILFSLDINLLNKFGKFFGVARGADLIVYISIILLFWFYFELLNKIVKEDLNFTKFVTNEAIDSLTKYREDLGENFFEEIDKKLKDLKQDFKNDFLFLIRAYNEEPTIGKVIDDIVKNGFSKILVINDGSTDKTLEIIKEKQILYKDKIILVLSHLINRGGGAANKTGFEFIKRFTDKLDISRIITFDADGQMKIEDLNKFFDKMKICEKNNKGKNIYIGSRFIKGGRAEGIPFLRKIILFGSKIVTFLLNGVWVSDPHNGYRVLPLSFIKELKITSDGMTYASELLEEAKKLGYKFVEIPVNIEYTKYSISKGQKNLNALKILLELIYKKFFYK